MRFGGFGMMAAIVAALAPAGASRGQTAIDPGKVRFDFETGDLQGWRVVEGKFDFLVCDKKMFRNRPREKYNKQGRWFLTSLELKGDRSGDSMTGVVESPVFVPTGPEMTLLVGGGRHKNTYIALCTLDGKEVLQARGRNTETMFPKW